VNHFRRKIERMRKSGCSFVIINHARKAETARVYRGGSAIRAGCDYMFTLTGQNRNGLLTKIEMNRFKSRSGVPFGNKESKMAVLVGDDGSFVPQITNMAPTVILQQLFGANPDASQNDFEELAKQKDIARIEARKYHKERKAGSSGSSPLVEGILMPSRES
jgi:hypothetical protein